MDKYKTQKNKIIFEFIFTTWFLPMKNEFSLKRNQGVMGIFEIQWWHNKDLEWRTWRVFQDRMLAFDQFKHLQNKKTLWRIVEVGVAHNDTIKFSKPIF